MNKKRIAAAVMAAVLASAALPSAGYAGPAGGADHSGPQKELTDNKLTYGDLGNLIENYNAGYKNAYSQVVGGSLDLGTARSLSEEAAELRDDANDLSSSDMDESTKLLYESYKETAKELRKEAQKLTNAKLSGSAERSLRHNKNKLIKTAQGLYIKYGEMASKQEAMEKQVELAKAQADSIGHMSELGLKSQADVLAAQKALLQAQNGLAQYESGLQNMKQSLYIMVGLNHDSDVVIDPPPAADETRIASMNPQTDLTDAVGANYDLQSVRNANASDFGGKKGAKEKNIAQSEQEVASSLQKLYSAVLSKKQDYDSAASGFQAAEKKLQAADISRSTGGASSLDYLNTQTAYLNAKAAMQTADMELFAAMEDYDWAVKGLIMTSGGQ